MSIIMHPWGEIPGSGPEFRDPLSRFFGRWVGRLARLVRWLVALLLGLVAVLQGLAYLGWDPLPAR
jgi:hypothetical protein